MSKKKSIYEKLGVDPRKDNVKQIFAKLNDQEYPGAFVNIITDPFNDSRVLTQHQDGDGSKFIQRLIHYYESGDESVLAGMVDDALSMNTGDIAAAGFINGPWVVTNVLNLNFDKPDKEAVMKAIACRLLELRELYDERGIKIKFLGGETADLRDQVKSGVFDMAITAWADKKELISGNVMDGDVILGVQSDGQADWEEKENSGIMSNGLTMARSSLMSKNYNQKYPKLKRDGDFYKGRYDFLDCAPPLRGMTIGNAILSPTRQWALVIREIIKGLTTAGCIKMLHGITLNSGGGATKISNLGRGISYCKLMPVAPPLFKLIQAESGEDWENMYTAFNCGVGIDIVGENNPAFISIVKYAVEQCNLSFFKLGHCEPSPDKEKNEVVLVTPYGDFQY